LQVVNELRRAGPGRHPTRAERAIDLLMVPGKLKRYFWGARFNGAGYAGWNQICELLNNL